VQNNQRNSVYTPDGTTPGIGEGGVPGGADPFSYYGAIPKKGSSNFMPITADFSKFGR
jgi:hypothetical protein